VASGNTVSELMTLHAGSELAKELYKSKQDRTRPTQPSIPPGYVNE